MALRQRNVAAEIKKVSDSEWINCLNRYSWLIEVLLLIEYYPAERDLIRLWRDEALQLRRDLFHVLNDNKRIIKRRRDELLAEAWKYGREKAIGSILVLENKVHRSSSIGSINREITDRWSKQLPENYPYEWNEIASITPMQRRVEPMGERWPRVVAPTVERRPRDYLPHCCIHCLESEQGGANVTFDHFCLMEAKGPLLNDCDPLLSVHLAAGADVSPTSFPSSV